MKLFSFGCILFAMTLFYPAAYAETMSASIKGTQEGSTLSGNALLEETPKGLKIHIQISGAPPGLHGLHIHEHGSCEDLGKAAGDHFNPDARPHGDLMKDGLSHAHAGDLGNIEIDPKGNGRIELTLKELNLRQGRYGVAGRAIILHEKVDDFGQPFGNAGARIACAVISTETAEAGQPDA